MIVFGNSSAGGELREDELVRRTGSAPGEDFHAKTRQSGFDPIAFSAGDHVKGRFGRFRRGRIGGTRLWRGGDGGKNARPHFPRGSDGRTGGGGHRRSGIDEGGNFPPGAFV